MKIGFFGTPSHSAYLLEKLLDSGVEVSFVVTNPDKPSGRGKELMSSPVKNLAVSKGLKVLQPTSLKLESVVCEILSHPVDLQIVYAYGAIIPKKIFDAPLAGTINLHGSILPAFRGASPVQSAILEGLTKTGFTLQYITEELDAGDIISTGEVEITEEDNFGTVLDKITKFGTEEILRLLKNFNGKKFPAYPQNHSKATYCKKILPESRKINFLDSAWNIHNRVRAYNPGNICYAFFREKRINIYKTRLSDQTSNLESGTLIKLDKKTIGFIAGDRKILILEEVQPENKKVMSGLDFLNGIQLKEGEKLL